MSDQFVDMLREKTEEGDLNSILKSGLGGYSKRSVSEYLAFVNRQQQDLKAAYLSEVQRLEGEKESLRSALCAAQEQAEKAQSEWQVRCAEETAQLREEYAALEKDMDEAVARIQDDAEKLRRMETALAAEKQNTEQARQSAATGRLLLDAAGAKTEELEKQLDAQNAEIVRLRETEQSLKEALAEDTASELNLQIQELMGSVELLQSEVAIRDRELENRAARLETLTRQEQSNHCALEELQKELQERREQNERIECENDGLGERLKEQMEQSISLSREISRLKAAGAILQRRLDAALAKQQAAALSGTGAE